jgi:hypothetical protein
LSKRFCLENFMALTAYRLPVKQTGCGRRGLRLSGRQPFTPLGPACVDDCASTTGCHAGTEAVTACAFQITGLKCTFHRSKPLCSFVMAGNCRCLQPTQEANGSPYSHIFQVIGT